jgi:MoxR-like ATPase
MAKNLRAVAGQTHPLPNPFLLIATQNPIELEGTYPLPEAEIDRFMIRVNLSYPDPQQEKGHYVKPTGMVYSYDVNQEYLEAAHYTLERLGLREYVDSYAALA